MTHMYLSLQYEIGGKGEKALRKPKGQLSRGSLEVGTKPR